MKKFKFSLETVMKLRKLKVDEEIRNLSVVVGNINRLNNEIRENTKEISDSVSTFPDLVKSDMKYLKMFDGYIKGLTLKNEQLQRSVSEQDHFLEEARQKVILARKDAEIIEIIKRKRHEEFRQKMFRAIRHEEDERNRLDQMEDRRNLKYADKDKDDSKPSVQKQKKQKVSEKPKSDYEKLLEYYEASTKPQR
ncbi:MAG TPA: hypothetical protein PL048_24550 [Leptospiraceae bacterium]|nr:hypothetical protein [Leptospiraceae bacterium]HMY69021.1 hypothetical protein [Leptospiraceae bacterium]HMZ61964.1 hypothetical protein [Leptospiraceae bacterium]HNF12680.1 hypothetical protein [Leptospiraceae bacterium]HNF23231.1 hypothetical protein [Leptospiraceae bacterium]